MTTIDYGTAEKKPGRTRWPFWALGGLLVLVVLVSTLLNLLTPHEDWETARKIKCASNLKQIGLAVLVYSNAHRGHYPDSFEEMLLTEGLGSEVFTCPNTNDTKAPGATPAEQAGNLSKGGHLSYVYLGKGMNSISVAGKTVVAYEPLSNHAGNGGNILYGDGHVNWEDKTDSVWATLPKH